MGTTNPAEDRRLVLLIDNEVESRRQVRHLLELHGMEVVQASNGIAALELIQRLPTSFRLVLTEIDLPGISGTVVAETLRLFRPDLPTLCMSARATAGAPADRRCLSKPLQGPDLQAALEEGSRWEPETSALSEEDVLRAKARFAAVGNLVEAALELARHAEEQP